MRSREKNIGEDHTGATKHIVFQSDTFVDRNVILDFAAIPDANLRADHYVLSYHAASTDTASGENMSEMPYSAFFADPNIRIDDSGGMYENGGRIHLNETANGGSGLLACAA
jgi:hypothetical protein